MTDEKQTPRKVYDVTIPIDHAADSDKISPTHDNMAAFAKTYCKHYVYARQRGEVTEKEHWQCRFTLRGMIYTLNRQTGQISEIPERLDIMHTQMTRQRSIRTRECTRTRIGA